MRAAQMDLQRQLQTKANKDTQARDLAGQAPTPAPVYPRRGARPPYARNGGAGQETRTPPPAPVDSRTGAAQEVTCPPVCAQRGRDTPRSLRSRANRARRRGTSPHHCSCRSRLRVRGGGAQERGARDRTHDAGRRDKARASPPSPSCRGPRAQAMPEAARRPPRFACRGHTQTRGPRAGTRTGAPPTPVAPRPRLHARVARERGRALSVGVRPWVHAHATCEPGRTEAAPPPRHMGERTGGRARAKRERADARKRPPPLSPVRAPGPNANGRLRGTPPLPWVRAPGPNASGRPRGSPPLPWVRAPGANASGRPRGNPPPSPAGSRARAKCNRMAEAPPSSVYALRGARGSGGA
ncbi:hypothetical protein EDB89DRAFT_2242719 [Lactarius sanguifluus]|nr:hypothetical protein EDB89DRAFT_2242719 [Lactarius sanguifluus]